MSVRETIILKTQELMYQRGYVDTSISQIMDAAGVGKGQLYHYFKSKKDIGLEATANLLEVWNAELIEDIFGSQDMPAHKFTAMLEWVCHFHENQEGPILYGCPVGNLIMELSTQDDDFRHLLRGFMNKWHQETSSTLQDLHADWSVEKADQEAQNVLAMIQGAILLMKLSQDLSVIQKTVIELEEKYL